MSTSYPDLNNTTFPDAIQTINEFLDVVNTDAVHLKAYHQYKDAGNDTAALAELLQIPNYAQKFPNARIMNTIGDTMKALERLYESSGFQAYIAAKQSAWQAQTDQFTWAGAYSNATAYEKCNIVSYTQNGETKLYIVMPAQGYLDPPIGTPPTNANYWRVFTIKGATGPAGTGMNFYGEWSGSQTYPTDSIVIDGNGWYSATSENTNRQPSQNPDTWHLEMETFAAVYPMTETEPTNQNIGDLWFEILD